MSSYASLILVPRGGPIGAAASASDEIGCAAGYVPLGWMALFRPTDLCLVAGLERGELTCFTTVAEARRNLAARWPRLLQVFGWGAVGAEHLPVLDAHLARLDPHAHVQLLTDDLYSPWSRDHASSVREELEALDHEVPRWSAVVAMRDGRLVGADDDRRVARFPAGTAVNACVGWLSGEPAPNDDDGREPDRYALHDAFSRMEPRVGRDGVYAQIEHLLDELLAVPDDVRASADGIVDASYDHEDSGAWLRAQLPGLARPLRNAVSRSARLTSLEGAEDGPFELDDPEQRRLANCVWHLLYGERPRHDDWAVQYALGCADVRLRTLLAMRYFGSGQDGEDDFTKDGEDLPADPDEVWEQLIDSPEPRVRWALRFNARAPRHVAVDDPSPLVRAWHPDTPGAELVRLARHPDPEVQMGVIATTRRVEPPTRALVILSDALGVPTMPPRASTRSA